MLLKATQSFLHGCCGLLGVAVLAFASGCGASDAPPTIPVSGEVTYNGQPVINGTMTFVPQGQSGRPATATIKDGKFATEPGKGLMVGEYKVTVTAMKRNMAEISPSELAKMKPEENFAVPARYMDAKQTDLTVSVSSDDTEKQVTLALKD